MQGVTGSSPVSPTVKYLVKVRGHFDEKERKGK
jgi:hypothetical protein